MRNFDSWLEINILVAKGFHFMNSTTMTKFPQPNSPKKGWPWNLPTSEQLETPPPKIYYPKISIVTPSYNQGQFIEETIRSVLLQGYPNFEYFVIDGGSTDNTVEILKKYEKFLYWISEPDKGQTDAINKGLKLATGEIFAYLNSDDFYTPGTFDSVALQFMKDPDLEMVYGDVIHIDRESKITEKIVTQKVTVDKVITLSLYIPQPSVFLKRSLLKSVGYFDESLNLAMDLDYWIRVLSGHKSGHILKYLSAARLYPDAKSTMYDYKYRDECLYIIDKFFSSPFSAPYKKLRQIAVGMVFIHAGRVAIGRLQMQDARKYFLKSLKIYHKNIFNYYVISGIILSLLGVGVTGRLIKLKRNVSSYIQSHAYSENQGFY